jgi:hypothetical protein
MTTPEAEGSVDVVEVEEAAPAAEEPDEIVSVTIGEAPPPESTEEPPAPAWVKEVRQKNREQARRIRELEDQAKAREPAPKVQALPPKPTLQDHDYDEAKFEASLAGWFEVKRKVDDDSAKAKAQADNLVKTAQERQATYKQNLSALKVDDADEAEDAVVQHLSIQQQDMLLEGTDAPHLVVLALGRNPAKLKELAEIKSPAKFAVALGKLESQVQVTTKRKPSTSPESSPSSGAARSGLADKTLERLEADAEKSGDRSKVQAYKRSKKAKG